MTSKADKLPLETEPVARDNNTILTLKPGDQTLSRLTQLIIVVIIGIKDNEIILGITKNSFGFSIVTCLVIFAEDLHHQSLSNPLERAWVRGNSQALLFGQPLTPWRACNLDIT